jgi:hypothetical protein
MNAAAYNGVSEMPTVQTIVTLASLAAIASCVFAISWVGLALLGF